MLALLRPRVRSMGMRGIPAAHDEHPERGNHNSLRLLLPHRPPAPAHAEGRFAHAQLYANHVPHARARRAGDTAQRLHRLVHPSPSMQLALVEVRLAPRALS